MKLIPMYDRTGWPYVFADPQTGWLYNLRGHPFALVVLNGVYSRDGIFIGWFCGDYIRDKEGRVVVFMKGARISGVAMPTPKLAGGEEPKCQSPPAKPMLKRFGGPMRRQFEWGDVAVWQGRSARLQDRIDASIALLKQLDQPQDCWEDEPDLN